MARRKWLVGLVALMVSLSASGLAAEKVRFASHIKGSVYYVIPVLAALEKNFWKEKGLEVEWFPFDSAATMVRAVAAGNVDSGTHGLETLTIAVARGVPEVMVADPKISVEYVIWVAVDSPLKDPKDLKGARIGVSRLGTSPHLFAQIAVKALGLEKDVKFVGMGGGGPLVAAFKARRVAGVARSIFDMAALQYKGEARVLLRLNPFAPEGPASTVIYGHTDFLAKQPEAVRKIVQGFIQAGQYVMKDRGWSIERMKAEWGFDDAGALAVYPLLRYGSDGRIDVKKIESALDFVVQYGMVAKDKAPPLEKIYAKGFAD